jgi:hypothetical protein
LHSIFNHDLFFTIAGNTSPKVLVRSVSRLLPDLNLLNEPDEVESPPPVDQVVPVIEPPPDEGIVDSEDEISLDRILILINELESSCTKLEELLTSYLHAHFEPERKRRCL